MLFLIFLITLWLTAEMPLPLQRNGNAILT